MSVLDRMAGLEAAATPRPWQNEPNTGAGRVWVKMRSGDCEPLFNVRSHVSYKRRKSDAALIVEARNCLPALIAVARAARTLVYETNAVTDPVGVAEAKRLVSEALAALEGR